MPYRNMIDATEPPPHGGQTIDDALPVPTDRIIVELLYEILVRMDKMIYILHDTGLDDDPEDTEH